MALDPQELLKPHVLIALITKWRWVIIGPLFATIAVGIFLAIKLPKIYEASTLILIQPQKVPTSYVQSLVTDDADARITTLKQQILSRSNLESIIKQLGLFNHPEQASMHMEDKINALRRNILVVTTRGGRRGTETSSFTISFRGEEPEMVMHVTNSLASSFISENLRSREAQAIGTSDFLEAELASMRATLEQKESEVERFRTRYMGELPEQLETNLRVLDRLQDQLISYQESLRDAQSRLTILQNQPPTRVAQSGSTETAEASEPDPLDIDALRAELARLKMRYTEQHPDIIRLKIQIQELEQSAAQAGSGGETQSVLREPTPVLQVRNEISSIRSAIARLEAEIRVHEERVESIPKREQELAALQRDYEDLQTSYSSLLNRKLEAEIAVNMERKQQGEQFRIIDRAQLPARPIKPNMLMLLMMTVAAGFGLGGGLIFVIEFFNQSFRTLNDIEHSLNIPTLTVIPFIANKRHRILGIANNVGAVIALSATSALLAVLASITLLGVDSTLRMIQAGKNVFF